jgi:hypothetical protein
MNIWSFCDIRKHGISEVRHQHTVITTDSVTTEIVSTVRKMMESEISDFQ